MSAESWPALSMNAGGFASAVALPRFTASGIRSVGPFVTLAHALPAVLAPGELPSDADVRPHPHIGIATLSYLLAGQMTHRDSLGNTVELEAGALAWMRAGKGIVHSERYDRLRREGGMLEGFQIWVAMPDDGEDDAPTFEHHPRSTLPVVDAPGIVARVLVGKYGAVSSPASAIGRAFLFDLRIERGSSFVLTNEVAERAIYVIAGAVEHDGLSASAGECIAFADGNPQFVASEASHILCFGGDPLGPRSMWWNFVASSKERVEAAKVAWANMRMPLPDDDKTDFTPLPADHERPFLALNQMR